ncbi:MAG: hypothetical protein AAB472_00900 [Patescibacteria group bacterium]
MKYSPLITATLSLVLILGIAVPAFAEDRGGDDATSINTTNTIQIKVDDDNTDSDLHDKRERRDGLLASTTLRIRSEREEEREREHASSTEERIQKRVEKVQEHAGDAIDKRIESLRKLSERLAHMKLLSADTLASIKASLDAEIKSLIELKAKIGSDTSTSTVKADASEITKAHRVYLLVEPKARIAASASRINAVVTQMQLLVTKLEARIAAAQTAGADVIEAQAALTDLKAKIADAKVQADAAVALTVNLQPDNGDATVKASNLAALKDARTKLELAHKDLAAAREDAGKIFGVVKGKEGKGEGVEHSN